MTRYAIITKHTQLVFVGFLHSRIKRLHFPIVPKRAQISSAPPDTFTAFSLASLLSCARRCPFEFLIILECNNSNRRTDTQSAVVSRLSTASACEPNNNRTPRKLFVRSPTRSSLGVCVTIAEINSRLRHQPTDQSAQPQSQ